ncbi:MAG: molybdopterin cofactor-binding domain-containing protein [Steroidobacteraceae bacterium]
MLGTKTIDRRQFLQWGGATGTVLSLAFSADGLIVSADALEVAANFVPNGYLQISGQEIILFAPNPEIGQGVKTALPMIVAEELDAAWEDIQVRQAVIDANRYGSQAAGGSTSVPRAWEPLRRAGATARTMLIAAAAARWQVPVSECATRGDSAVHHLPTQRRLTYLALAADAAALPVPAAESVILKSAAERRLLKRRVGGVDNRQVVTGQKLFASDIYLPGMAYAVYVKCPAVGGSVATTNLEELKREPGVIDVFVLEGNGDVVELQPGVAIVANSTWAALKARRKLKVEWNEASAAKDDWAATSAQSFKLAESEGAEIVAERGELANTFTEAAHQLNSIYQYAFLSHAQLEPQVCVARMTAEGGCELWPPSQTPQRAQKNVANVLKLDEAKITIHPVRVGGGFGRRLMNDYACEAAAIAQRLGRPVKLQWTREDDMTHDFVRAGGTIALRGAVDTAGRASAWQQHLVTFTRDGQKPVLGGDLRANEDFSQLIPNFRYTRTQLPWGSPTGFWRAPGASVFAFPLQSFLHEMSAAAGRDHLEFLLDILGEPRWLTPGNRNTLHTGRAAGVLKLAAEKSGWNNPLPKGRARGLAFYFSHTAHVAEVAEVSVSDDKAITVHSVTVVCDVGPIVNLSGAESQCQGSVIDGLSAMLDQKLDYRNGRVQQTNFDRYRLLRMGLDPRIDVHFIESDFAPSGLGEPALPPVAPAVCNAVFSASGHRIRRLPIGDEGYRFTKG